MRDSLVNLTQFQQLRPLLQLRRVFTTEKLFNCLNRAVLQYALNMCYKSYLTLV